MAAAAAEAAGAAAAGAAGAGDADGERGSEGIPARVKLFIGGLPVFDGAEAARAALRARFAPFGVVVGEPHVPEKCVRGGVHAAVAQEAYAFITLAPRDSGALGRLRAAYRGATWEGRRVRVEEAKESALDAHARERERAASEAEECARRAAEAAREAAEAAAQRAAEAVEAAAAAAEKWENAEFRDHALHDDVRVALTAEKGSAMALLERMLEAGGARGGGRTSARVAAGMAGGGDAAAQEPRADGGVAEDGGEGPARPSRRTRREMEESAAEALDVESAFEQLAKRSKQAKARASAVQMPADDSGKKGGPSETANIVAPDPMADAMANALAAEMGATGGGGGDDDDDLLLPQLAGLDAGVVSAASKSKSKARAEARAEAKAKAKAKAKARRAAANKEAGKGDAGGADDGVREGQAAGEVEEKAAAPSGEDLLTAALAREMGGDVASAGNGGSGSEDGGDDDDVLLPQLKGLDGTAEGADAPPLRSRKDVAGAGAGAQAMSAPTGEDLLEAALQREMAGLGDAGDDVQSEDDFMLPQLTNAAAEADTDSREGSDDDAPSDDAPPPKRTKKGKTDTAAPNVRVSSGRGAGKAKPTARERANARAAAQAERLQKSAAADIGKRWGEASCKTGMWRDNIGDITTGAFTLGAVIGGGSDPPARSAGGSGDVAGAANACKTGMWREDLGELTTSSFKLGGAAAGEEQAQRRPRDDKPPEGSVRGMDLDVDINGGLGGSGSGDRGGQTLTPAWAPDVTKATSPAAAWSPHTASSAAANAVAAVEARERQRASGKQQGGSAPPGPAELTAADFALPAAAAAAAALKPKRVAPIAVDASAFVRPSHGADMHWQTYRKDLRTRFEKLQRTERRRSRQ